MSIPAFPDPDFIDVNGITLEVFTAGHGKPLVLCHGWPELAWSWRYQIQPLVDAGYQVIIPNQRGYGRSTAPDAVQDYDIRALTADLIGLLDHYGHRQAVFIGHDWGAIVLWNLMMMFPERVAGGIQLSVGFMERGPSEWVGFWESHRGADFYIVHFNRQPGVAAAVFDANTERFLRNLYRGGYWHLPAPELGAGNPMVRMAERDDMPGDLIMSEAELAVFVEAFKGSGFNPGINYYRNFSRNWEIIGEYEQRIQAPVLMLRGEHDTVPKVKDLGRFVDDLESHELNCGHWIQQEQPEQTNALMLDWLSRRYPAGADHSSLHPLSRI